MTKGEIVNRATTWIVVGPFLLWAAWEAALIVMRANGWDVRLVSGEAKRLAFRGLPTLAYFLAGLTAHFFFTWARPTWSPPWDAILGVLFWSIGAAYLVADWLDPKQVYWPLWAQWLRYPPVVAGVGLVAGWGLFPQRSLWFPGGAE